MLLQHFLTAYDPLIDPDKACIQQAERIVSRNPLAIWRQQGAVKCMDNDGTRQAKDHIAHILAVNYDFHEEGIKILMRRHSVTFTHCVGTASAIRFMCHIYWSAILERDEKKSYEPFAGIMDHSPSAFQARETQRLQPLAYMNMAYIELRWVCRRYIFRWNMTRDVKWRGLWKSSTTEDNSHVMAYIYVQILAYPRVKTLVFDFVGWDQEKVQKPFKSFRIQHPSWAIGRIPEIIIRGLPRKQQERVVHQITPFVKKGGRIGTTSSHYSLADDGRLARVVDEEIVWRHIAMEEKHPLLEEA